MPRFAGTTPEGRVAPPEAHKSLAWFFSRQMGPSFQETLENVTGPSRQFPFWKSRLECFMHYLHDCAYFTELASNSACSRGQTVKRRNALANARSLLMETILSGSSSPEKVSIVKEEGRLQSLTPEELKWPDRRWLTTEKDRWNWLHIDYCIDYSNDCIYSIWQVKAI